MKRTLQRHKNQQHPTNPRSVDGIREKFEDRNIMEKYGYNLENDSKFYIGTVVEDDYAFTVFASIYVIEFIQKEIPHNARNYLMDGTFDSLPTEFYQLLIISVEYRNDVSNNDYLLFAGICISNHLQPFDSVPLCYCCGVFYVAPPLS